MVKCGRPKAMAAICVWLVFAPPAEGWSNRGHRLVNLVAAESLPPDMPAFIRTPRAIAEIAYLGPEPDRWRPEIEPELSNVSAPDHAFRVELGILASPLPRRRVDFQLRLDKMRAEQPEDADRLTPQRIGTLPWQAEEIWERLQAAFRSYRIATGALHKSAWPDEAPIGAEDLPYIEDSILYYAGWMGHYIADGSMPLHDTVNVAGWILKENPNGYTRKGEIHHRLELVADSAIEQQLVTDTKILPLMAPVQTIDDPFAATLRYLQSEGQFAEAVYKMDKQGAIEKSGSKELDNFLDQRMAEGGGMLRDMIYSAWVQSKNATAPPDLPKTVTLVADPHR